MERNSQSDAVLTEYIRPLSSPVAFRFLKARTSLELFGHPLALCQGVGMVRRYGRTMAYRRDDHRCPSAVIAFGHLEPPEMLKRGDIWVGFYAKDAERAVNCAEIVSKMPVSSVDALCTRHQGS